LTSCRREPTASRRSGPTSAPPPASAMEPACSSSPSPATGSARSLASTTACSHGSGCRDRSQADRQLASALYIANVNATNDRDRASLSTRPCTRGAEGPGLVAVKPGQPGAPFAAVTA
jgi:hypothetical protein